MDDRSDNTYSQKDNDTYANQFGNNFGNYTNVAQVLQAMAAWPAATAM